MSRASLQFPLKAGATDWGSATLGRPRGRGFVNNDVLDADVICNGSGKVVAALVEDTKLVGRTNLGRARGPGEAMRASSPTSVKPLRLVAMKDEEEDQDDASRILEGSVKHQCLGKRSG